MTRTLYAIWDIDNCLFDDQWRTPAIEWHKTGNARYERYNKLMLSDPVKHQAEFNLIRKIAVPVFFTGRCEIYKNMTLQQLAVGLDVIAPTIYMRKDNENASPADVKQRMLKEFLECGHKVTDIFAAFDDLPSIVDMYRSHGIPAVQLLVNEHSRAYDTADSEKKADFATLPGEDS